MAYSNWITTTYPTYSTESFAKGYSPEFPAEPNANCGEYCRELRNYTGLCASGSQFVDVGRDYAIRAQVLAKGQYYGSDIALFLQSSQPYYPNGYYFILRHIYNGYGGWAAIDFGKSGIAGTSVYYINNYNGSLFSDLTQKWTNIRLTSYPVSENEDRVIGEIEDGIGSGNWIKTVTGSNGVFTFDAVFEKPTTNNRRNGVMVRESKIGYIDKLSVSLAAVPVPIL